MKDSNYEAAEEWRGLNNYEKEVTDRHGRGGKNKRTDQREGGRVLCAA